MGEADLHLEQWIGLNRQDTLSKKLYHFTNKQFQFSEALNFKIQQRFAVLKGQLYLPLQLNFQKSLPDWINLKRRLGYWGTTIPHSSFIDWKDTNGCVQIKSRLQIQHIGGQTVYIVKNSEEVLFYMFRHPSYLNIKPHLQKLN